MPSNTVAFVQFSRRSRSVQLSVTNNLHFFHQSSKGNWILKMAWVGRKYKLEKSENFGDYMKALGEKGFFFILNKVHMVWHTLLFFYNKTSQVTPYTPFIIMFITHANTGFFFSFKFVISEYETRSLMVI